MTKLIIIKINTRRLKAGFLKSGHILVCSMLLKRCVCTFLEGNCVCVDVAMCVHSYLIAISVRTQLSLCYLCGVYLEGPPKSISIDLRKLFFCHYRLLQIWMKLLRARCKFNCYREAWLSRIRQFAKYIQESPLVLLSAFYVYNMSYPKGLVSLYSFLEYILLDKKPLIMSSALSCFVTLLISPY